MLLHPLVNWWGFPFFYSAALLSLSQLRPNKCNTTGLSMTKVWRNWLLSLKMPSNHSNIIGLPCKISKSGHWGLFFFKCRFLVFSCPWQLYTWPWSVTGWLAGCHFRILTQRVTTRIKMQRGSRFNEDQDATRIMMQRGSRCNEDQDSTGIKMQRG